MVWLKERSKFGQDVLGGFGDIAVREAAIVVTPLPRATLALVIALPGVARVVVLVAVELDGELVVGPPTIDPVPIHMAIGGGKRQAGLAQQAEECALEHAQCDSNVTAENFAQVGSPGCVRPPREDGLDLRRSRAVANLRLVDGPRQITNAQKGRKVDKG